MESTSRTMFGNSGFVKKMRDLVQYAPKYENDVNKRLMCWTETGNNKRNYVDAFGKLADDEERFI